MKHYKILKKISYLFIALAMVTFFTSCERESGPETSDIAIDAFDLRGTWVVDIDADGDPQDYNTIKTYNTGDNGSSQMWLDDLGHGWGLKAKVNVDPSTLTFSGNDLEELYYGVTVTITDGVIIPNEATSSSGEDAHYIYFKAEFSDLAGVIWEYYGFKSSGQVGDLP